jgi:hypothetical protein
MSSTGTSSGPHDPIPDRGKLSWIGTERACGSAANGQRPADQQTRACFVASDRGGDMVGTGVFIGHV